MTIDLELQNASGDDSVPGAEQFEGWLTAALAGQGDVSVTVRLVGSPEMQTLNARYRGSDKPTNVLSFTADVPQVVREAIDFRPLGDIVLCAPVVRAEAARQGKPVDDHWAHLTIHGALHLLGHDHQDASEAAEMEALEVRYLAGLGIPDPYRR